MLRITHNYISHPRTRPALRPGLRMHYSLRAVRGIVVHWTANRARGADANAHRSYFNQGLRAASAHYVTDSERYVLCVPEREVAFHCGDRPLGRYKAAGQSLMQGYKGLTPNFFTVGIELCVNADGDWTATYARGARLAAWLLRKHMLSPADLYRHYDITGKGCPQMMLKQAEWDAFKAAVRREWDGMDHMRLMVVMADSLNVRIGPGSGYADIDNLPENTPVLVNSMVANWAEIEHGRWVSARFLSPA